MAHPLVRQLRFTRSAFLRAVKGVNAEDGRKWLVITKAADPWLDTLTSAKLEEHAIRQGNPIAYTFGNMLQRVIYQYWYHTGENMAIRQMLGHARLPEYVG